ncbi:MAG: LamG domain-containing protein [Candidatus Micrarchaeota archaeon]|nr:LamG domain-containing protein [Candidatus Micrarchaeota archaeon]
MLGIKLQSAMEYLMTYGWAILIIAVVMIALYSLGIFNNNAFGPRATAGACQVVRNTQGSNLEGQCSNVLPKFVAQLDGRASYISLPLVWPSGNNVTISAWIYLNSIPGNNAGIVSAASATRYGTLSFFPNGNCFVQVGVTTTSWQAHDAGSCISSGQWYHVVGWANQANHRFGLFIDGVSQFNISFGGTLESATSFNVGQFSYQGAYFPGDIANVQIYNTSLSQGQVTALYQKGIGAAPIDTLHIVGWWPLNGDENDYSGNGNNGNPVGVTFMSNWLNGYSQP